MRKAGHMGGRLCSSQIKHNYKPNEIIVRLQWGALACQKLLYYDRDPASPGLNKKPVLTRIALD